MASPVLVSSIPANGSTDIQLNKSISLTFAEAIYTGSLGAISLYNNSAKEDVEVEINLSPYDPKTVIVLPNYLLNQDSTYRIIMAGTDLAISGEELKSADLSSLTGTLIVDFSVGEGIFKIDTTLEKQTQELTLEGQLFLPTNIKALGTAFSIESITPKNHTHSIPVTTSGIVFDFTKNLYTGLVLSNEVNVDLYPLMDEPQYLGTTGSIGDGVIPAYSVSSTGNLLSVNFSGALPTNLGIRITLSNNITSSESDTFAGLTYTVNTQLYPSIFGVNVIKREIGPASEGVYDDYIGSLLCKNSILLWEFSGRSFNLAGPTYSFKSWVALSTALDIIEDQDYMKFLEAGTRNMMGDRDIDVDSLVGRLAMKVTSLTERKRVAWESINRGWSIRTAQMNNMLTSPLQRQIYGPTWQRYINPYLKFYQPDLPMSNVDKARDAKTLNPYPVSYDTVQWW